MLATNIALDGGRTAAVPTTDDRRPTTDDQRPTTDDQRPTTNDQRIVSQSAVSRILSAFARLRALRRDDHSSSPVIADGIKQPTRKCSNGPFVSPPRERGGDDFPIWPCSVRGFACHRCCHRRGALLPHLFTIACPRHRGRQLCVFCATSPSSCPDRALPGALPCGVRTFLPPTRHFVPRSGQAPESDPDCRAIRGPAVSEARSAESNGDCPALCDI